MADCLFYRGISSKYPLFLLLPTNYSHCRVLSYSGDTTSHEWLLGRDIILCLSRSLIAIKGRTLFMAGIRLPMHFFEKKTAKNFVVSIIIPNFALAFRPEAYYKTIVW